MPKYFYVCTDWDKNTWVNDDGYLAHIFKYAHFIGGEDWPYTRREARLKLTCNIFQFERATLKFVKQVK